MSARCRELARRFLVLVLAAGGVAGLAAPAFADDKDKEPPKPPKSVEVQTFVILASKGETEHIDPSLKELAELLKQRFKDQLNRFRLHKSLQGDVKLDPGKGEKTASFALIEDFYLKVAYHGIKKEPDGPEMIRLSLALVRVVEETKDDKTTKKEVRIIGPLGVNVVRERFILLGGPKVGNETLILAIRVLK